MLSKLPSPLTAVNETFTDAPSAGATATAANAAIASAITRDHAQRGAEVGRQHAPVRGGIDQGPERAFQVAEETRDGHNDRTITSISVLAVASEVGVSPDGRTGKVLLHHNRQIYPNFLYQAELPPSSIYCGQFGFFRDFCG